MLALVTVSVFGLFHPTELDIRPAGAGVLVVEQEGRTLTLEGARSFRLRSAARVTGRDGAPAAFVLSVPGKIQREFHGRLEVRREAGHLLAIVEMDRETAVASIVAAESMRAGLEALKAQAVAARSFLIASRHRHDGYDFCDTTHCQFMKEPPPPASAAMRATNETHGLALAYQGKVFAALYSADCGGHTRTLEQAGWKLEDYPYFAVECPIKGRVSGHQLGLCQRGAAAMAAMGATFRAILAHYFPATSLIAVE